MLGALSYGVLPMLTMEILYEAGCVLMYPFLLPLLGP